MKRLQKELLLLSLCTQLRINQIYNYRLIFENIDRKKTRKRVEICGSWYNNNNKYFKKKTNNIVSIN